MQLSADDRLALARKKHREYMRIWNEKKRDDPKFKASRAATRKKYKQSEKGKLANSKYYNSEIGTRARARQLQNKSDEFWERRRAYQREYYHRCLKRPRSATVNDAGLLSNLLADAIYAAAHAIVPRSLPDFKRDDIISDLCLAVLTGEIQIQDMKAKFKQVLSRYNSMFSNHGELSLDNCVSDGSRMTWHEVIQSSSGC